MRVWCLRPGTWATLRVQAIAVLSHLGRCRPLGPSASAVFRSLRPGAACCRRFPSYHRGALTRSFRNLWRPWSCSRWPRCHRPRIRLRDATVAFRHHNLRGWSPDRTEDGVQCGSQGRVSLKVGEYPSVLGAAGGMHRRVVRAFRVLQGRAGPVGKILSRVNQVFSSSLDAVPLVPVLFVPRFLRPLSPLSKPFPRFSFALGSRLTVRYCHT